MATGMPCVLSLQQTASAKRVVSSYTREHACLRTCPTGGVNDAARTSLPSAFPLPMTKSSSSMRLTLFYWPKPEKKAIRMSFLGSLRLLVVARGLVSVQHSRSSILRAPHVARATFRVTAVFDSCPAVVAPSPLLGPHVARSRRAARRRPPLSSRQPITAVQER